MRIVVAFLISPPVGAALFAMFTIGDGRIQIIPWSKLSIFDFTAPLLIGGYPPALVLGVPVYFSLRNVGGPHLLLSMLAGALIASAPWFLLSFVLAGESSSNSDWWQLMQETTIPAFLCGSGAGFSFWLVAR